MSPVTSLTGEAFGAAQCGSMSKFTHHVMERYTHIYYIIYRYTRTLPILVVSNICRYKL